MELKGDIEILDFVVLYISFFISLQEQPIGTVFLTIAYTVI